MSGWMVVAVLMGGGVFLLALLLKREMTRNIRLAEDLVAARGQVEAMKRRHALEERPVGADSCRADGEAAFAATCLRYPSSQHQTPPRQVFCER